MRAIALAMMLVALPASAQMYKCVDERGRVQYSDKPLAGCKGGTVNIQPIPPVSGELAPVTPKASTAEQDAGFKRRQMEREHLENLQKTQLEQHCTRARQELGWLTAGTRLSQINDVGERVYMDDATREKRIAELRQQVRGCP